MKQFCRKLIAAAFVICTGTLGTVSAQNALPRIVEKQLSLHQSVRYSLFQLSDERSATVDKAIRNAVYLKLDPEKMKQLWEENAPLILLDIPLPDGRTLTAQLMQYDFRTQDYRNVMKSGEGYQRLSEVPARFYRGGIKDAAASMAAFSFFPDEIGAVFASKEQGNYNLVLNREQPGAHQENYILYRDADILDAAPSGCSLTDEALSVFKKTKATGSPAGMGVFETNCNAVRVSVFADSFIYAFNSRSVVKSVQYINTVFNVISALYANDGLFLQLSETVVSTVKEGYDYTSSSTVLIRFGNLAQTYVYNGDVAQSVTGYRNSGGSSPLGGLAWLDVLCQTPTPATISGKSTYYGPYSMANTQVMATIPSLPTYSWDVEVCAHELGHNIGSPHTQSCSWPTGPIDNCVAPEGGCSTVGPAPVGGGTIMSYCHLKPSVGINFANGFGSQPQALLIDRMTSSSCLRTGVPDSTLLYASRTVIANAECFDGLWTHYFFDNNTANPADDIFVMSIQKGALDIGDINNKDFVLKMTTGLLYGKDTVPRIVVSYADTNWAEINRKWTVQLPSGKQPKSALKVRYPYLNQDLRDIRNFSAPKLISDTALTFLKYASMVPVTTPAAVSPADVRKLPYASSGSSPKFWRQGVEPLYRYVEVVLDSGIYGGTLGYQRQDKTGLREWVSDNTLRIHPNPVQGMLSLELPASLRGMQLLQVFDNLGRLVRSERRDAGQALVQIDLSSLHTGTYTLVCTDEESALKYHAMFLKQ